MTRFFHIIDLIGYIYRESKRPTHTTRKHPSYKAFFHNIIETMKSQKKTDDGEFSKALLSTLLEEEEETKTGSPKLARTVQASKFGDLEFEIESNNSNIVLYLIEKNRKKIKLVSAQQIAPFMEFLLEQSRYIKNLQTKVEKRMKQAPLKSLSSCAYDVPPCFDQVIYASTN